MKETLSIFILTILLGCGGGGGSGQVAPPSSAGCGPYPSESTSPYVLPYESGTSSFVSQGNCTNGSHRTGTPDQYAYDFLMPIGTLIIASRAGTVSRVLDTFADNTGQPGEENVVGITHADGSVALYFHLAQNGAMVSLQQAVDVGDTIALSGNSGNSTEPHLHFVVTGPPGTGGVGTVPVTFNNTDPHANGLQSGRSYAAR
ncbi:MAG: M23 family metallopeptidase [Gammaproteobacteria bacterium]|nr:M23 family metallopeptidase [Gammaproteobacteria bacterium]